MRSLLKVLSALFGLAAGLFVIAATYLPHVETSFNYTYSLVPPQSHILYGIGVVIISFALIADKLKSFAGRLVLVPILVIAGLIVHSLDFSEEGSLWAARQAAFDTPLRNAQVDLNAFWQEFSIVTGQSNARSFVESWGVHGTFNNVPVYQNAIFSLSKNDADRLLEAAKTPQTYYEQGFLFLLLAFVCQLLAGILLWITPKPKE